jgi:hypothetical protein
VALLISFPGILSSAGNKTLYSFCQPKETLSSMFGGRGETGCSSFLSIILLLAKGNRNKQKTLPEVTAHSEKVKGN